MPKGQDYRVRADGIDNDYDHDLASGDDYNIIIAYDTDSDYSPCDSFEGLEFHHPVDGRSTTCGNKVDTTGS